MGTAFVAAALVCVVALAIRSVIKNKNKGKSLQCGGDCSRCNRNCHEL
ncbi:MAG: FeoB-associated Cys-rich membrane protein [Lachnospiraceae bacterium]|nr:FeoB-associated Cys-rich membrane protein [Lachnospiraceae bacterium]